MNGRTGGGDDEGEVLVDVLAVLEVLKVRCEREGESEREREGARKSEGERERERTLPSTATTNTKSCKWSEIW